MTAFAFAGCAAPTVPERRPAVQAPPSQAVQPPQAPQAAAPPVGVAPPGKIRVALLLPLSGSLSSVGRAMLNAAQMAYFDVAPESLQLLPRDTGGTPEGAAAAARDALGQGAQLILGPLTAPEASAVGSAIGGSGVNVITFSNDRSVARNDVFVLGLLPSAEVDRIVGYASARGLKRFGVLAPDTPYGDVAVRALQKDAPSAGISIDRVAMVPPNSDTASASKLVQRFAQSRSTPIDALLLPMGGQLLLTIAPLLPYYEIDPKTVQFLGTGLWDQTGLAGEPALHNGWYAAPPPEARAGFLNDYKRLYGGTPPRVATLAYDATALAAVLARSDRPNRFDREAITQPNGFSGLDGIVRFRQDGLAERGLAVLQVTANGTRILDPAPTRFEEVGY